jgi:chromosomal replication initiator protein
MEKSELWQACLAKLELNLSRPNFLTWFQETGILDIQDGIVTVFVPNGFAKEWLQNKYHKAILHSLREISTDIKDINYIISKPESAKTQASERKETSYKKKHEPAVLMDEEFSIKELNVDPETNLNPRYTFDNFVVGSFNELAHAASQSVIEHPGFSYNPLFIYGGVGLGKTHLIQAVGNAILHKNPGAKIRYVPSEKYLGEIVDALKNQEMSRLKEKYRTVDVLIIDDIQFIARTEKMQEEFFHTFNSLYEKNKQIVISSDRPPHAIATLEERLRSRFEGGMIADIGLPDFETRLLILKTKADAKKISLPEDVLRYIAENIKTNIRELEGALNRVVLNTKISNAPVNIEAVKKLISGHQANLLKFVSAKKIIKSVAEFYNLEEKDLTNRSRRRDVVKPRQIAMYLMREELKSSFPSIGDKFGGRDHTTAIHSCEKIENELKVNPELEEEIRMIKERLLSS